MTGPGKTVSRTQVEKALLIPFMGHYLDPSTDKCFDCGCTAESIVENDINYCYERESRELRDKMITELLKEVSWEKYVR